MPLSRCWALLNIGLESERGSRPKDGASPTTMKSPLGFCLTAIFTDTQRKEEGATSIRNSTKYHRTEQERQDLVLSKGQVLSKSGYRRVQIVLLAIISHSSLLSLLGTFLMKADETEISFPRSIYMINFIYSCFDSCGKLSCYLATCTAISVSSCFSACGHATVFSQ